jgi:hypothetical protein
VTVTGLGLWYGAKDGKGGAGDGRQFWYTEYNYRSSVSPVLNGGVAACSSEDLISWRFEGIVFHYTNLSDLVLGTGKTLSPLALLRQCLTMSGETEGPFYVERPKVLFNAETSNYVMWAVMDNSNRSLAMSAIATSFYEDGYDHSSSSLFPPFSSHPFSMADPSCSAGRSIRTATARETKSSTR